MTLALELDAVSKRYVVGAAQCFGSVAALRSVDLQVRSGEAVAIVGGPGAGKSTLLLCAAGLLTTDSGRVRWFGEADRAFAMHRATYYFVGSGSHARAPHTGKSTVADGQRVPHIHLIDGSPDVPEAMSAATALRRRRWVERRCAAGDTVLIAARSDSLVRDIVSRSLWLRAGSIYNDDRAPLPARVAERSPV